MRVKTWMAGTGPAMTVIVCVPFAAAEWPRHQRKIAAIGLPHPLALRKSGPIFARNEIMPMMSLAELQRRVDSGDLSADAAITQSLEAIGAHDKTIGAFVCRNEAVRAANAGPLRGIAVGIKDIIDTSDFPTQMGSKIYSGWQPRADAPVVMMLKQAGAGIVGKTTTTAFASVDPTATLNPRNPNHTPGGSSSGSATAVAAGMIPLALGTQTGGSVIRPAPVFGLGALKTAFPLLRHRRGESFFSAAGTVLVVLG